MSRFHGGGYNQGGLKAKLTPKTATDFYEHIIDKEAGGYALYKGYCKSTIDIIAYGGSISTSGRFNYRNYNKDYVQFNNFFWTKGGKIKGGFKTEYDNNLSIDDGSAIRTIKGTLIESVICTPTSIEYPYFNRYSTVGEDALWCKDDNIATNTLHTINPEYRAVFQSSTNSGAGFPASGTEDATALRGNFSLGRRNSTAGNDYMMPFLGFTPSTKNFNKIYVKDYDDIIDDLISKSGAHYATDSDNKKHLLSTNGLVLVKAAKGEVINMPLKFDKIGNEYKNIDIWLKASAFKSNENVKTTTDADIIKAENVSNMIASAYSNAITCDCIKGNGEGELKFTMPKDGYVFMKWSVSGNEAAGGGTFHPQTLKVQLVD